MPAPAGYVPGLGRGATGFTTRSDIGPARTGAADAGKDDNDADDDERFRDPENDTGLFATGGFDKDDEEADRIYSEVDQRIQERRKAAREAREKAEREEIERKNPKISNQFADLKRALGGVSADEWAALQEPGDLTRKNKRTRREMERERRSYRVPDTIIAGARNEGQVDAAIDPDAAADGSKTDFRSISSARDRMLEMKLNQATGIATAGNGMEISNGTATSVDPTGYLNSLNSSMPSVDIGDIKRVRELLQSLTKTQPLEPRGWIGLARLEELANRMARAREAIGKGCENCPRNEDVWLENMRLNERHNAKIIAARAVRHLPKSIAIWMAAADLETDPLSKKRVVKRALEANPTSDTLWKEAVNLEADQSVARMMLAQAVESVPLSEDLWLALARLETPKNARKVLNRARKALRVSRAVWIAACRLEEQDTGDAAKINALMARGVEHLAAEGAVPERSTWLADAIACEKEDALLTCSAIIRATIGIDIDEEDRKATWIEDAKTAIVQEAFDTARAIYEYALETFPSSKSLWRARVDLEKTHTTNRDALWAVLDRAIVACPSIEYFWFVYAREKAQAGDIEGARGVFREAFEHNRDNERLWLAAFDLEADNGNHERASQLLADARRLAKTERVWVKSVTFERQLGHKDKALELAQEGLKKHPEAGKLYMQLGQIYEDIGDKAQAEQTYAKGTRASPKSVPLWLLYSRLYESQGVIIKARSVLDRAALVNEKDEQVWLERILLEKRAGNTQQAGVLIAKALQELPKSALIWSEHVTGFPRLQRPTKFKEAITACENGSYLMLTIGKHYWNSREKAKVWFQRAIDADHDNGDAWLWLYKAVESSGESNATDLETILQNFDLTDPKHGVIWPRHAKDINNFGKSRREIFIEAARTLRV